MGNIGADALPIRRQGPLPVVADPGLQIRGRPSRELQGRSRGYDGFRCRKPKEVSIRQAHLGTEEIVIRGVHKERRQKGDVKLYFLPGDRTFASGELIGKCVYTVYNRVGGRETRIQDLRRRSE